MPSIDGGATKEVRRTGNEAANDGSDSRPGSGELSFVIAEEALLSTRQPDSNANPYASANACTDRGRDTVASELDALHFGALKGVLAADQGSVIDGEELTGGPALVSRDVNSGLRRKGFEMIPVGSGGCLREGRGGDREGAGGNAKRGDQVEGAT